MTELEDLLSEIDWTAAEVAKRLGVSVEELGASAARPQAGIRSAKNFLTASQ